MYFESTELSKLLYGCVALGIILVLIAALGWILVYYGGYRTIGVFWLRQESSVQTYV